MTVSSVAATPTTPSAPLREVPPLLLEQWSAFTRTPATVLHWRLQGDEWEWVEAFLDGRLDGVTKLFVAELPATTLEGYGFALGRPLMDAMLKTKFPRKGPWQPLAIPRGARDTDALAALLGSFANHAVGTWVQHVGLVVAPASIPDERAWLRWVQQLLESAARFAPTARLIFLDDAQRPRYSGLGTLGPRVCSVEASLHIAARVAAMTEAADDGTVPGQLRILTARTMQCVNEGRVDDADRLANAVEALATDARCFACVVPVRFAVAGALTAQKRHPDAVRSYRSAERAAEQAEQHGDARGLSLRVLSRFGVAAGLLAAPEGARQAATYYQDTVPLCQSLGDPTLELEALRCAALAHELAKAPRAAWDASVSAIAVVDRLTEAQRQGANLIPLVDTILRLLKQRELVPFRPAMEGQLRRRRLRGTAWE